MVVLSMGLGLNIKKDLRNKYLQYKVITTYFYHDSSRTTIMYLTSFTDVMCIIHSECTGHVADLGEFI